MRAVARHLLPCVSGVLFVATTATAALANPEAPAPVLLRLVSGGVACQELARSVEASVTRLSSRIRFVQNEVISGASRMDMTIRSETSDSVEAHLTMDQQSRVLRSTSCTAMADAIALVLLIALDPDAAPQTSATPATQATMLVPAPHTDSVPPTAVPRSPLTETPRRPHSYAGASGVLWATPFNVPSVGIGIWFGIEQPRTWDARLALSWSTTRVLGERSQARFDLVYSTADFCAFGLQLSQRISASPCAGAALGFLYAEGLAVAAPRTDLSFWADIRATGRFKVHVGNWALVASAGAAVPLLRPTFIFERPRSEILTVPSVAGVFGFGAELHFL
jgi:hypothetical protein